MSEGGQDGGAPGAASCMLILTSAYHDHSDPRRHGMTNQQKIGRLADFFVPLGGGSNKVEYKKLAGWFSPTVVSLSSAFTILLLAACYLRVIQYLFTHSNTTVIRSYKSYRNYLFFAPLHVRCKKYHPLYCSYD